MTLGATTVLLPTSWAQSPRSSCSFRPVSTFGSLISSNAFKCIFNVTYSTYSFKSTSLACKITQKLNSFEPKTLSRICGFPEQCLFCRLKHLTNTKSFAYSPWILKCKLWWLPWNKQHFPRICVQNEFNYMAALHHLYVHKQPCARSRRKQKHQRKQGDNVILTL